MAALSPTQKRQPSGPAYKMLAQPTAQAYVEGFAAPGIEGSKFFFETLLRYHLASLLVLVDQGIVPRPRARKMAGAFLEILKRGVDALEIDPGLEDLQPNVEKAVIALIGPDDAGDVGIARARAEFSHVAAHLALREETLATIVEQLRVNRQLLDLASRHVETIVPYYTQHMRAEPITFGYYFSSFSEAFVQNALRMRDTYLRFSRSPAGVGHIVPTPLPLDRKRIAEMMDLDEVVDHSLYAYLNSDVFVDALGTASISAATVSRLCLDFAITSAGTRAPNDLPVPVPASTIARWSPLPACSSSARQRDSVLATAAIISICGRRDLKPGMPSRSASTHWRIRCFSSSRTIRPA